MSLFGQINRLKVKAHAAVQRGSVGLQNPLDSSVDLLPVGWTGLTALEPFSEGMFEYRRASGF